MAIIVKFFSVILISLGFIKENGPQYEPAGCPANFEDRFDIYTVMTKLHANMMSNINKR